MKIVQKCRNISGLHFLTYETLKKKFCKHLGQTCINSLNLQFFVYTALYVFCFCFFPVSRLVTTRSSMRRSLKTSVTSSVICMLPPHLPSEPITGPGSTRLQGDVCSQRPMGSRGSSEQVANSSICFVVEMGPPHPPALMHTHTHTHTNSLPFEWPLPASYPQIRWEYCLRSTAWDEPLHTVQCKIIARLTVRNTHAEEVNT